ncbi:YraN family protein [Nesterenkonia populi]|uniref:YraN family protein n=1 Tax=Nesterenkonia populi TaxID=1591087 RepID=UPI0011BF5B6E|nr:YraN family protein [Nesterenkonia populi]
MRAKDRTGLDGEQRAAEFLETKGHRIIERRWRTRAGELDLITLDADTLVAVEVKTRRGLGYGHPLEAVDRQKLRRLHRLLSEYAVTSRLRMPRRVDAVGVVMHRRGTSIQSIDHIPGVV